MSDHANRRAVLTLEFNALAAQQNKAVKDATFGGWGVEEKAAYDGRAKRIAALCTELFPFDRTKHSPIDPLG